MFAPLIALAAWASVAPSGMVTDADALVVSRAKVLVVVPPLVVVLTVPKAKLIVPPFSATEFDRLAELRTCGWANCDTSSE